MRQLTTRAAIVGGLVACAVLSSCGLIDAAANRSHALQDALEKASGEDAVTLQVRDIYPTAEKVVLVCPYGGAAANDLLGQDSFMAREDVNEAKNWVATKEKNGAVVKVALDRSQVELCSGAAFAAEDVGPDAALSFEQRDGTWVLTAW